MKKEFKNIPTFEQYTDKNLNISDVSDSSENNYKNARDFLTDINFKDKDVCDYYTTADGVRHNTGVNWKKLSELLVKYADTLK